MRPQAEWKVRIQMRRAVSPSRRSRRSRISFAARFVNVIARISFGSAPTALIRCATRWVSTRVFPEPAPAMTSSGPSVERTASRWAGFSPSRNASVGATAMRPTLARRVAGTAAREDRELGVARVELLGAELLGRETHHEGDRGERVPVAGHLDLAARAPAPQ